MHTRTHTCTQTTTWSPMNLAIPLPCSALGTQMLRASGDGIVPAPQVGCAHKSCVPAARSFVLVSATEVPQSTPGPLLGPAAFPCCRDARHGPHHLPAQREERPARPAGWDA